MLRIVVRPFSAGAWLTLTDLLPSVTMLKQTFSDLAKPPSAASQVLIWMWENGVNPDCAVAGRTGLADAIECAYPGFGHAPDPADEPAERPPMTTAFRPFRRFEIRYQ